jgi:hypothetical protein
MALTDPQSVTIGTATIVLPRVLTQGRKAEYSSGDRRVVLSLDHAESRKRRRHVVRLDHSKLADDPTDAVTAIDVSMSVYMVVDVPLYGYGDGVSEFTQQEVYEGFEALITANSSALPGKLMAGES